ncbi:acetyl CoA carboxylase, partial [Spraguea lophii 42_110]
IKNNISAYKYNYKNNIIIFIIMSKIYANGSFSSDELIFYYLLCRECREKGYLRIFINDNSGVRVGFSEDMLDNIEIRDNGIFIEDGNDKIEESDLYIQDNNANVITTEKITLTDKYLSYNSKLISIFSNKNSGSENLSLSSLCAIETIDAYNSIFTLSYVSGMSVGIGAYLCRLGNRIIMKKDSYMLLTGYQALNKLLGDNYYKSNLSLGGYEVLGKNGIVQCEVVNDMDGIEEIFRWIEYYIDGQSSHSKKLYDNTNKYSNMDDNTNECINQNTNDNANEHNNIDDSANKCTNQDITDNTNECIIQNIDFNKVINKSIENYNEIEIIENIIDKNTYKEYMPDYAPNIITARAKIQNTTIAIISSKHHTYNNHITNEENNKSTTNTQNINNKNNIESKLMPHVLHASSSQKFSEFISQINTENLNLLIIANYKGFSGGDKDMLDGVLKYGSNIINELKIFKNKIYIYIPPNGQLRGGTYVIFDKNINKNIRLTVHNTAEVGVLEPSALCEIKVKNKIKSKLEKIVNKYKECKHLNTDDNYNNDNITYNNNLSTINNHNNHNDSYNINTTIKTIAEDICKLQDNTFRLYKDNIIDEYVEVKELRNKIIEYFNLPDK